MDNPESFSDMVLQQSKLLSRTNKWTTNKRPDNKTKRHPIVFNYVCPQEVHHEKILQYVHEKWTVKTVYNW